MNFIRTNGKGLLLCLLIAAPSWFLGQVFPVVGGAVIAIVAGMAVTVFWKKKTSQILSSSSSKTPLSAQDRTAGFFAYS